jgi:hypothetical protein
MSTEHNKMIQSCFHPTRANARHSVKELEDCVNRLAISIVESIQMLDNTGLPDNRKVELVQSKLKDALKREEIKDE